MITTLKKLSAIVINVFVRFRYLLYCDNDHRIGLHLSRLHHRGNNEHRPVCWRSLLSHQVKYYHILVETIISVFVLRLMCCDFDCCRCVIGMYPGFLAGSSEVLELIVYTATSALALSNICREIFHLNEPYWDLIISFGFYLSACVIYITGGRIFWNINTILAVISLGIILVYGFGSFQYINFMQYASYQEDGLGHSNSYRIAAWFRDPASSFFRALPLSTWFYIGKRNFVERCVQ